MSTSLVVESLQVSGRLAELVARAAIEGIAPMCGVEGTFVDEIPMPWSDPPDVLAIMALTDFESDTRSLMWIGGSFDALAGLAESLLGERPVNEDEMFEDCIRELANIAAGRLQEWLGREGITMSLGLPIYISRATQLPVRASLVFGATVRVRFDLPDQPVLQAGYVTEEIT